MEVAGPLGTPLGLAQRKTLKALGKALPDLSPASGACLGLWQHDSNFHMPFSLYSWHPSRPQSQGHGARSHLPGPHWLRSLGDRPAPVCLCVALPAAHCCQLPAVDSPRVSPLGSGALSWPADGGVEWLSRLRWSWKGLISYRVVIAGAARDPRPLGLDTGQADHGLGVASGPCRETLRGSGGGLPGPASPLTLGPSWCRPHTHMRAHGRPPPCCRCRRVPAVWTPCLEPGGPRLTCPYWVGPCWPWVPWTWPSGLRGQGTILEAMVSGPNLQGGLLWGLSSGPWI